SMVTFAVVGWSGVDLCPRTGASRPVRRWLLVGAHGHGAGLEGAAVVEDVLVELVAEVLKARDDRADGAVAEGAEGAAEDPVADVPQRVEVLLAPLPALHAGEDLAHPVGALTAGGALAARFVGVELGEVEAGPDEADIGGNDGHRGAAAA